MSIVNNLVACSRLASDKTNEFNFSCSYPTSVVVPKTVTLTKAVINNTLFTFKDGENMFYMSIGGSTQLIFIPNSYYDTILDLCTALNANLVLTNANITVQFDTTLYALKFTKTGSTVPFSIFGSTYNTGSNCANRLGFGANASYSSVIEGTNAVIYAPSTVKLLRTTGFYICSDLATIASASPAGISNIIDFVPIESQNLRYGDLIVLDNSNISKNTPTFGQVQQSGMSSCSVFNFQILDDEFNMIPDADKGMNTMLMFSMDYD